jgi:hypothetical protein
MRIIVQFILLLLPVMQGKAQTDSALALLSRSLVNTNSIINREIDIDMTFYLGGKYVTGMKSRLVKLDGLFCSENMGIVTICDNESKVVVDKENKLIRVTETTNPILNNTNTDLSHISLEKYNTSVSLVSQNSLVIVLKIVPPKGSQYNSIELTISSPDKLISKVVYLFSDPENSGIDRAETKYNYRSVSKDTLPNEFQKSTYIKKSGKNLVAQKAYASYKVHQFPKP